MHRRDDATGTAVASNNIYLFYNKKAEFLLPDGHGSARCSTDAWVGVCDSRSQHPPLSVFDLFVVNNRPSDTFSKKLERSHEKSWKRCHPIIAVIASFSPMSAAAAKVLSKTRADLTPKLTGAIKERIKELILGGTVVLFTKSYCPYCKKVKELFRELGVVDAVITELDEDVDGPAIQAALIEVTGQRSVPCVFVGGQHVGGNDDAQAAAKSGKLQKMLAACK